MAVLRSRCGHYIFVLWFLLSSFFPCLFSAVTDWMSAIYFHTWCGLSANLGCRSETCSTRLSENTGCKKSPKNSPSAHHRTKLSGYIFTTKARIDNRKNLLNSNMSPTCPYNMVNFGPLTAEICSVVWGTPANFNGFRVWASLLQRCRSPEANQTASMFGRLHGLVHYIAGRPSCWASAHISRYYGRPM